MSSLLLFNSRVDLDAGHGLDPLEVLGDPGKSVRVFGLATEARHEAGDTDGHVLASGLLKVEGPA